MESNFCVSYLLGLYIVSSLFTDRYYISMSVYFLNLLGKIWILFFLNNLVAFLAVNTLKTPKASGLGGSYDLTLYKFCHPQIYFYFHIHCRVPLYMHTHISTHRYIYSLFFSLISQVHSFNSNSASE